MKEILNLYPGYGGNRKFWKDVKVTAVEINPEIAEIYKKHFPNDNVIVGDAHKYLLNNFGNGWDFIWSSPPCQTHSRIKYAMRIKGCGDYPEYVDMKLYQEIIFLRSHFEGLWVVENVMPYYGVLIPGKLIGRHIFWSNFYISKLNGMRNMREKMKDGDQNTRNMVDPKVGVHILNCAFSLKQSTLDKARDSIP